VKNWSRSWDWVERFRSRRVRGGRGLGDVLGFIVMMLDTWEAECSYRYIDQRRSIREGRIATFSSNAS